jgi:protein-S-isoprenylcysteine O-methyltransferase Ste14
MHHFIEYRPPRIALSIILLAAVAHLLMPTTLHHGLPIAAAIVGLSGFGLMLRAWWLFRLANTAICPTDAATTLITNDVYSLTRNPMYLGMLSMLLAPALAMGSATFYVATIIFGWIINSVFCRYEERKSLSEFGEDYRAYSKRVRRWL